jgi:hypothetical protein
MGGLLIFSVPRTCEDGVYSRAQGNAIGRMDSHLIFILPKKSDGPIVRAIGKSNAEAATTSHLRAPRIEALRDVRG